MRKITLASSLYQALLDRLIANQLKPGEKINLDRLRGELGVSISPLREALSRLTATRLVEFQDQRGFTVSAMSMADFHELMEICRHNECFAFQRAIERGDLQWESDITAALYRLKNTQSRPHGQSYNMAHHDFHRSLTSACNMPRITAIMEQTVIAQRRYRGLIDTSRMSLRMDEHDELAQAALARDIPRATRAMQRHIDGVTAETAALLAGYFAADDTASEAAQ